LLTFKDPPEGMASPMGDGDAGAVLPSPSALQVLHSKFGHRTQFDRYLLQLLDDPVDAACQCLDVLRVDRREHRDSQLVAAEFAVGLGVHDSVGA
jgi:hypothetical protein